MNKRRKAKIAAAIASGKAKAEDYTTDPTKTSSKGRSPNSNMLSLSAHSVGRHTGNGRHSVGWKYADRPRPIKPRANAQRSFKLEQTVCGNGKAYCNVRISNIRVHAGRCYGAYIVGDTHFPVVADDTRPATWHVE